MGLGLRRVTGVRPFPSPHLPPFPSSNRPPGTNYRLFVCFFFSILLEYPVGDSAEERKREEREEGRL